MRENEERGVRGERGGEKGRLRERERERERRGKGGGKR